MKKSEAIREIVGKHGLGLTNREIQARVLEEHRLHCTSQQIIAVVGPYHERAINSRISHELIAKAREYLLSAGDLRTAKSLLEVAEVKR